MGNFKDVDIKLEYRSLQDDIVKEFYCPLLKKAKLYQRAVGFFSSTALVEVSKGIIGLVKNSGKIQLIASPRLSEEDIEAIGKGLVIKEEIISERLKEALIPPKNKFEEERLNLLTNLIAYDILEIKIAILEKDNQLGIYHEKMGVLLDAEENVVAFTGSMNESTTAFRHNYESIDVYKSWESSDTARVLKKQSAFNAMWGNYEPYMEVIDFPDAAKEKLLEYRKTDIIDYSLDDDIDLENNKSIDNDALNIGCPRLPLWLKLRPYQKEAIVGWQKRDYIGIFDMATGTGKTFTGLAAIVELYEAKKAPLAIFIVCPYQHLVAQWVEDIVNFGMKPIICHSASPQRNWCERLKDACLSLEIGLLRCVCAIFTNATYSTLKIQQILQDVKKQSVLIVDEAHNFGAENLSKFLDNKIPYRLALSATLERYEDEEGTKKLFDYFGDKCIEYSLKEAIDNDMLVRYYYHPIVVNFEGEELEKYLEISRKILKSLVSTKENRVSEYTKLLLIKRARLVAAAKQKITALVQEMQQYKTENHMLVYCGATTMADVEYDELKAPDEEKKQVDIVMNQLGNKLNMHVAKFTSEETAEQRESIKREFDKGEHLQALIAIRCLDEGVNIPSIRKAFILASSTNPKQYIQRRGRVLRKNKGKDFADIYDFILSPLPLEQIGAYDDEVVRLSGAVVKSEIERMKDFAKLAENPSASDQILYSLATKYNLEMGE